MIRLTTVAMPQSAAEHLDAFVREMAVVVAAAEGQDNASVKAMSSTIQTVITRVLIDNVPDTHEEAGVAQCLQGIGEGMVAAFTSLDPSASAYAVTEIMTAARDMVRALAVVNTPAGGTA